MADFREVLDRARWALGDLDCNCIECSGKTARERVKVLSEHYGTLGGDARIPAEEIAAVMLSLIAAQERQGAKEEQDVRL